MRDGALGQHLFALIMQAEDAPQLTNRVDLDPTIVDVFDRPVPRVTYSQHDYEKQARLFYVPIMKQVLLNAGATQVFVNPCDVTLGGAPGSRHVMGTLRMGNDPATSVVDAERALPRRRQPLRLRRQRLPHLRGLEPDAHHLRGLRQDRARHRRHPAGVSGRGTDASATKCASVTPFSAFESFSRSPGP